MAMGDSYLYFMKGRELVLLFKDSTGKWVTPSSAIDNGVDQNATPYGLELEYSAVPSLATIINESSILPFPDVISLAMVDYIKAKMKEEQGDLEQKEYYMKEFERKIAKFESVKLGSSKRITTGSYAIRR